MGKDRAPPSLCLFLTFGYSLDDWAKAGVLDRETKIYRALAAEGYSVGIFTYGDERDLVYSAQLPGIEIVPAFHGKKRPRSALALGIQSAFLPFHHKERLRRFRIFKSNQMLGSWVPLIAAFALRKAFVLRCGFELYWLRKIHGRRGPKMWLLYFLSLLGYAGATRIVVTTRDIAEFVENTFAISPEKISVVSNFVDVELFKPLSTQKLDSRVVTVGRLAEEKRPHDLVRAAAVGGFGLDFIGEGELKPSIEKLAKELGADVRFRGRIPNSELPRVLGEYAIYVSASPHEGNPKAIMEAMAAGLCVVGYDAPGVKTVIKNGSNGVLVPLKDVGSLAAASRDLLVSSEKARALGVAATEHAQNFSFNNILDSEKSLLRGLLS